MNYNVLFSTAEFGVGEHLLWTEQSGPSNLDPIMWPRAASSAEVGPTLIG